MRRLLAFACSLLAPLPLAAEPAAAPSVPLEIRAETVEYERERNVYVASGDVEIERDGRRLTADWVSFHPDTRKGIATGHVVVTEGGDTLHAEFLHFDVDTLEGIVFDGELDSPDSRFLLAGEEVRKTGAQTYAFTRGTFTTCRCPDEGRVPWRIRAAQADLDLEGYGTARNTTFEILGVPVLWLPWMIYPLKSQRQTGFLFPELNTSARSGGDVGVPFFWAARENLNVLVTPRFLFDRGFKPSLEIEYVFGERSQGQFFATGLPSDDEIDSDDPSTPFDDTRWAFEWLHDQWLPRDWRFKVNARALSDNLYSFDFQDFTGNRVDRYIESSVSLSGDLVQEGAFRGLGFVGAVQWADDQQNPEDQDRDQFLLQRLPQVTLALPARPLPVLRGRLSGSFDVSYTNFFARRDVNDSLPGAGIIDSLFADIGIDAIPNGEERDASGSSVPGDGSRDDAPGPEGDGVFQEGEPLVDRGQRLVLNPRLSLPFRLGDWAEVYPEVGYHGTFYDTDSQSRAARHLLTAQLDARVRLRREFDSPVGGATLLHLLEPRLGYTVVSAASQRGNPLFVPDAFVSQQRVRQLDLFNVTRDPGDRLESIHAVTLAIGNRFYLRRPNRMSRLLADLTVSTQYALNRDRFGAAYLTGRFLPSPAWSTRFGVGYDLDGRRLSEGYLQVSWGSAAGHDLSLRYRYLRTAPRFFESFRFDDERFDRFEVGLVRVNQVSLTTRWAVTARWALTYSGRFSFEESLALGNRGGIEYLSGCQCWAIRLELRNDRNRGLQFSLRYRLVGLGRDEDPRRPFQGRGGRRGLLD